MVPILVNLATLFLEFKFNPLANMDHIGTHVCQVYFESDSS